MISSFKYPKVLLRLGNIALLLLVSHLISNAQELTYSDSLEFSASLFRLQYDPVPHGIKKGAELGTTIRMVKKKIYMDSVVFEVPAIMDPDRSWIRPDLEGSEDVLAHEKIHFCISELYARKLRKKLREGGQYSRSNYDCLTKIMYRNTKVEWRSSQRRYDEETRHGADPEMQKKWEAAILEELEGLKEYANPKITLPVLPADRN
jgi:hypothetical protein